MTTAIAVGFLGAYTTFSTFGYETLTLLRTDQMPAAIGYIAISLVGGLAATALGYVAGRAIVYRRSATATATATTATVAVAVAR